MPLCLTTADKAACVPVFIHLRKYHLKPHLSCIGYSLTFHFVWQTLIFTSKVLSRRHPTHTFLLCCLSRGCFGKNCKNTHIKESSEKLLHLKVAEKYCQICWMRTLVGMKCVGDTVSRGLSKHHFSVPILVAYFEVYCSCTVIRSAACNSD